MSRKIELALRPKRTSIEILIHPPATPDEECPILQDPIATATLENFPRPFLTEHPTYTAVTLQCKHTFHAMALIYHWARSKSVLCPVCRAGPKGQNLAMSRLPNDWKYSMSARIKREHRQDQIQEENQNRQLAMQHQSIFLMPPIEIHIRVEAESGVDPATCTLRTEFVNVGNIIIFDVPLDELQKIPYGPDTLIRFIPYTRMHVLQPSNWFRAGADPGGNFSTSCDNNKRFIHIHLVVRENLFTNLMQDILMDGYRGHGFQLLVLAD